MRTGILKLSPESLLQNLGLPGSVTIGDAYLDKSTHTILLRIYHSSLPHVSEGAEAPVVVAEFEDKPTFIRFRT